MRMIFWLLILDNGFSASFENLAQSKKLNLQTHTEDQ